MNLLDENFPQDQLPLLKEWHVSSRLIEKDIARFGAKDPAIIPLLHRQGGATFFTLDGDFFEAALCHPAYGLVWLDVRADDAAYFVRCFLKHPRFRTRAQRMGMAQATAQSRHHHRLPNADGRQSLHRHHPPGPQQTPLAQKYFMNWRCRPARRDVLALLFQRDSDWIMPFSVKLNV